MAMYKNLRGYSDQKAAWISQRLIDLRQTIRASDLGNRRDDNLVIGSWNIRAFDEGAPRRDESFHYIAEIIDHFILQKSSTTSIYARFKKSKKTSRRSSDCKSF